MKLVYNNHGRRKSKKRKIVLYMDIWLSSLTLPIIVFELSCRMLYKSLKISKTIYSCISTVSRRNSSLYGGWKIKYLTVFMAVTSHSCLKLDTTCLLVSQKARHLLFWSSVSRFFVKYRPVPIGVSSNHVRSIGECFVELRVRFDLTCYPRLMT